MTNGHAAEASRSRVSIFDMDFIFVLVVVFLAGQRADAVKLVRMNVPPYTLKGESALLQCRYDLGEDKLYSVTWYKDHEEFYRYVPKAKPTQHSYKIEGIKVDHHLSNDQQVSLKKVGLHTSGLYRCEISAEAPSFTSVHGEARMEVISLPQEEPLIMGGANVYSSGDILALNCTSGRSFPPAQLKWFVNGVQVRPDWETTVQQHELASSVSSLRLEIGPGHVTDGRINVKCEATVKSSHRAGEPLVDLRATEVFVRGGATLPRSRLLLLAGFLTMLRSLPVS